MRIVKDTTKLHFNKWHDPGDYPNSLAGGPLQSQTYLEDVTGFVEVEVNDEEIPGEDLQQDGEMTVWDWPELFRFLDSELQFSPTKIEVQWLNPNRMRIEFEDWEWEDY